MSKSKTVAPAIKRYELGEPTDMVHMAAVLKHHVVSHKLYTEIQGRNYVHVEGWQFAGGLLGTYPRTVGVEKLTEGAEIKWLAEVEIVNIKTDQVMSRGFAICSSKEEKKGKKVRSDEYQIMSMAQTRAIGKAYRNVIGWVMKLAGYESTPSEEMPKGSGALPDIRDIQIVKEDAPEEYTCIGLTKSGCGEDLTKQENDYSFKRYGKPLCREHQKEAKPLTK